MDSNWLEWLNWLIVSPDWGSQNPHWRLAFSHVSGPSSVTPAAHSTRPARLQPASAAPHPTSTGQHPDASLAHAAWTEVSRSHVHPASVWFVWACISGKGHVCCYCLYKALSFLLRWMWMCCLFGQIKKFIVKLIIRQQHCDLWRCGNVTRGILHVFVWKHWYEVCCTPITIMASGLEYELYAVL